MTDKPMTYAERVAFLKTQDYETLGRSDQLFLTNALDRERTSGIHNPVPKAPKAAMVKPHQVNPDGKVGQPRRVEKNIRPNPTK